MANRNTAPESLYGTDRDYLREQEHKNELLAQIAGESYTAPTDIPKGKYIVQKRMLDAAQKENELLESIAESGTAISGATALNIDYPTDILSLKKGDDIIAGSGVTLPTYRLDYDSSSEELSLTKNGTAMQDQTVTLSKYGLSHTASPDGIALTKDGQTVSGSSVDFPTYGLTYDSGTGGLTLQKNGTSVQGSTVSLPPYGTPLKAPTAADMTDEDKVYVYTGSETGYTNGDWYYYDGSDWVDGGAYNSTAFTTDTTLSVSGAAADAKVTGDNITNLKNAIKQPNVDWTIGSTILSNGQIAANEPTYAITGMIPCQPGDLCIFNTPEKDANNIYFISYVALYATTTTPNDTFVERANLWGVKRKVIDNGITGLRFVFGRSSSSGVNFAEADINYWNVYYYFKSNNYEEYLSAIIPRTVLSNCNMNNIVDAGMYFIFDSDVSTITNLPTPHGGLLLVFEGRKAFAVSAGVEQVYFSNIGTIHYRYKNASSYTKWTDYIENGSIPDTSIISRMLNDARRKMTLPCSAVYSTLPKENATVGVTAYYNTNEAVNGVIYSSVWPEGNDVYWNKTLETYYSALANPASILYTKNVTDKGVYNAHAVWGGVCSSLASYVLNMDHYYYSDSIRTMLNDKAMPSIEFIEVGDILCKEGHIAFISQTYFDKNSELVAVEVTEQVAPVAKKTYVYKNNLQEYLDDNGYTVKENTFGTPRALGNPEFAEDIIYEYGNNTYVDVSETAEMWFYIADANATKVYVKKDNGAFSETTISGLPNKMVNGATVRNLASLFSGVGEYVVTTNTSNAKKCYIKIIDVGTYSISNGVLTLSEYSGCTPKQLFVANLIAGSGDKTLDPPDGYWVWFNDQSWQAITSDIMSIGNIPASGKYKLCIDYETGVGLKRVVSNNIGV